MGNDTTTSNQTGDIWINGVAFTSGQYNFISGNWYHIVVTTDAVNTKQTWDQGIRIGNRSDGTSNGNAGYFDQVRTFNRRLTSADVALLYAEVETGATADQTAGEILSLIKTVDGASSGLDADLLDGQHGSHYLDYNNFSNTPTIAGAYVPLSGGSATGQAMTGNLHIVNGGPKIYLKDNTDDDDQAIYFQNNSDTIEYVISTQDFTQDGLADGMFIGSISSDELGLVTNNTTALYIDTSQNSKFFGNIKVNQFGLIDFVQNIDIDSAAAEMVAQVAIATYTAAFFDFVVKKGTNVRSGTVYACHDGTNVEFTETSTNDLGNTSDVTLSVDISGANMRLLATVTSNDWSVKSLIRAI
jgi:hypothetical protein